MKGDSTMSKTIEELAVEIKAGVIACNEDLGRGFAGLGDFASHKAALDKSLEDYNDLWADIQFREFISADYPVIAAIQARTIKALSLTVKKDNATGIVKSVALQNPKTGEERVKEQDIDLVVFEEWAVDAGFPRVTVNMQWRYAVEKFNYLMNIRTGGDVGGEASANSIRDNYKLSEDARKCEMALPTGNKAMVQLLQSIVDMICFIPSDKTDKDGAPLNAIKVDMRDIKYIESTMHSRKSAARVSLSRDSTMRTLITDALYKNLTGRNYEFEYEHEKVEAKSLPGFTLEETKALEAA